VTLDGEGRLTLLFTPACEPTATADRDRIALTRLASID
jgi:hypothetical protein